MELKCFVNQDISSTIHTLASVWPELDNFATVEKF